MSAAPIVYQFSYGAAGLAFAVLVLLLVTSWGRVRAASLPGRVLIAAAGVQAIWCFAVALLAGMPALVPVLTTLETVRTAVWLAFLLSLLRELTPALAGTVAWLLAGLATLACVFDALLAVESVQSAATTGALVCRALLAIAGLLLLENIFRNSRRDSRWGLKYLFLGAGGLFAYDFFMYADALLFSAVSAGLAEERGLFNALLVPFLAVAVARNPQWSCDIFVSRSVAFHTATLTGSGAYLLAMAVAAYYLREFGGTWGPLLQTTFFGGALLLLLVALFSGRFRSELRLLLNKHFFSRRYDYREEWLRLIDTIAAPDAPIDDGLPERVIEGVADVVDATGGAIWLFSEPDTFRLRASRLVSLPTTKDAHAADLARFLDEEARAIVLTELANFPERYDGLSMPGWLPAPPLGWLLLPLIHRERLLGCMLLAQPRAERELTWEDHELLRILARQAASYIAEDVAAQALAEARQFEAFNRHFTFIVHDLKNLIGQLTLTIANAGRYRDNQEFYDDMVETLESSVARMNRLLADLKRGPHREVEAITLSDHIRTVCVAIAASDARVSLLEPLPDLEAAVVADRLASVVRNLINNAREATGPEGSIRVRLRAERRQAVIEIDDDGPGMGAAFIRERLFKPFASTKPGGFGIGVFEARVFAEESGGRLDVISQPGRGTIMRLCLPLVMPDAQMEAAE